MAIDEFYFAKGRAHSYRDSESNKEIIKTVVEQFRDGVYQGFFARGISAGYEAMTWRDNANWRDDTGRQSPIVQIAAMPAWEGSHRSRMLEQDLVYSLGAVVGCFACIEGLPIEELTYE